MSHTVQTYYVFRCDVDRCHAEEVVAAPDLRDARPQLRALGWVYDRDVKDDYCPRHKDRLEGGLP